MRNRSGEAIRPWFRTDRFYHTNSGWWFLTREKSEKGPFATQNEAQNELMFYVRKIEKMNNYPSA